MMTTMTKTRTYSELIQLETFEERLEYLRLYGKVGEDTFGFDRWLNQKFYTSYEWRKLRNDIIARDMGCDLAIPGFEITGKVLIHHMNPISIDDILNKTDLLLNPEFLICTCKNTHDIIHYGNRDIILYNKSIVTRRKNDTCPWRH